MIILMRAQRAKACGGCSKPTIYRRPWFQRILDLDVQEAAISAIAICPACACTLSQEEERKREVERDWRERHDIDKKSTSVVQEPL